MYTQIASNKRRSIILIFAFVLLVAGLDYVIARAFNQSQTFFYVVLAVGIAYAFISYFFSAQMALSMSGAQPIEKKDAPELYRVVENLTIAAGLPMPKVYIINDPAPNAFATGRDPNHAVVAVTSGLLSMMDKDELEGVIAHELSHVGNYDIRFMALVVALVSIVAIISDLFLRISWWGGDEREGGNNQLFFILGIVGAILAPIVAALIQFAVSRQREYLADASGALLTRYPEGLASALAKIGKVDQPMQHANSATSPLYISNPLKGRSLAGLFDTHPPIADRITRLREMESKQ
jgi:heat shock protein HtpX